MLKKKNIKFLWLIWLVMSIFIMPLKYQAATEHVIDQASLLTSSQINDLNSEIKKIGETNQLDVVVVTVKSTDGKSDEAFADDYYDENGYGLDDQASGLLLLINMEKRTIHISTTGRAIDIFTDNRIQTMVNHITAQLKAGDYNSGCLTFLDDINHYAASGVPVGQKRVPSQQNYNTTAPTYLSRVVGLMKALPVYVIALVISILVTYWITISNKGRLTINNLTYEEKGSFELNESQDLYLRETTTRVKIQQNNSSTHSGSSGSSHGGGGGSF